MTLLQYDNMSLAINDSQMMLLNGFTASFHQVYHEKVYKVQRPRLNETNLDPDCYKDGPNNITHSRILRNWDWDLGITHEYSAKKKDERRDWHELEPIKESV